MALMRGRGVIITVEWDENGNVVAIGISTHDEDEYIIEDVGKGGGVKGSHQTRSGGLRRSQKKGRKKKYKGDKIQGKEGQ